MWHVDEGALHAYLDGALDEYPAPEARRVREHLETCAECAASLADERRVREEAQEILGLAAPSVEVPTFEELRAYVRAQAPHRSAASARLYKLGWAASVVLALGTGWLLRGGAFPTTVTPGSRLDAVRAPTGRAPVATPSTEERPSGGAADEPAAGTNAAAAAATLREEQLEEALPERGVAPAPSATTGAPSSVRAAAPSEPDRDVVAQLDEVAATSGGPGDFADTIAAVDRDQAPRNTADDTTADQVVANARRAAPEPTSAAAPTASSAASRGDTSADGARQDSATRDDDVGQRAAEQRLTSAIVAPAPSAAGLGAGATTLGRAATTDAPTDPTAEAEAASLVVPGLEVLGVLPVGQGTTFAGMRALQRLQSGDTLELVHLPGGIDPGSLPPLRQGWTELVRPRGSGWLVMRAPLPEASLIELLQRLESGR